MDPLPAAPSPKLKHPLLRGLSNPGLSQSQRISPEVSVGSARQALVWVPVQGSDRAGQQPLENWEGRKPHQTCGSPSMPPNLWFYPEMAVPARAQRPPFPKLLALPQLNQEGQSLQPTSDVQTLFSVGPPRISPGKLRGLDPVFLLCDCVAGRGALQAHR